MVNDTDSLINFDPYAKISLGTTIMAVSFDGGVVLGADSRTSSGSYVANRVSDKLTPIADNIYVCRSGSAADTQAISAYVEHYLRLHTLEKGKLADVSTAATIVRKLCYENRNALLAGMIVAGYDEKNGGSVYTVPPGGMLQKMPFSIGGSGSSYIYGYCDSNFKENMSREECIKFVTNAVSLAISRDGSSGGVIRLAVIDKSGVQRMFVPNNELPTFFKG